MTDKVGTANLKQKKTSFFKKSLLVDQGMECMKQIVEELKRWAQFAKDFGVSLTTQRASASGTAEQARRDSIAA